jgi:hypothetical protein
LLAGNGVEKSFENCGIARRLEADKSIRELTEEFLFCGEGVEIAEVDFEAEHIFEGRAKSGFQVGTVAFRVSCDGEARMRSGGRLFDSNFDDFIVNEQGAAVALAVPTVENVFWAAAQGPDREVEAKRWDGMQNE